MLLSECPAPRRGCSPSLPTEGLASARREDGRQQQDAPAQGPGGPQGTFLTTTPQPSLAPAGGLVTWVLLDQPCHVLGRESQQGQGVGGGEALWQEAGCSAKALGKVLQKAGGSWWAPGGASQPRELQAQRGWGRAGGPAELVVREGGRQKPRGTVGGEPCAWL